MESKWRMNVANACLSLWRRNGTDVGYSLNLMAQILEGPLAGLWLTDQNGLDWNVYAWDGVPGHLATPTPFGAGPTITHPHFPWGIVVESDHIP